MAAVATVVGAQAVTLDATWQAAGGPDALCAALDALCRSAGGAVHEGTQILPISDRAADRERAPLPLLLAGGAAAQHLRTTGRRSPNSLRDDAGDGWDLAHVA